MALSRWKNQVLARVFTAFPSLASRWAQGLEADDAPVPWAPARKPLREATVALITTGGLHPVDQKPFDMADEHGDPTYREVPADTPRDRLTITHDYYNHADAEKDLNLILPVERLRELEAAGALGRLHPRCYSFMGHIDGPHLPTLVRRSAPEVARKLVLDEVDCVLLVPA